MSSQSNIPLLWSQLPCVDVWAYICPSSFISSLYYFIFFVCMCLYVIFVYPAWGSYLHTHQPIMPFIFPISIHLPQPGSCGIAQGKILILHLHELSEPQRLISHTSFCLLISDIVVLNIECILTCIFLVHLWIVLHTWPSSSFTGRVQRVTKFLAVSNWGQAQSSPPVKHGRAVPLASWALVSTVS